MLVAIIGCGGDDPVTDCTDGRDNDGDGLIDELDPACPFTMGENEFDDPTECNDTVDNDGDALIDLDDYGCDDAADDEETDPTRQCNDSVDNDGDELIDHAQDPGCETPIDDDESNPALCGNGLDDDGDARIDYPFDPGCDSEEDLNEQDPPTVPLCSNTMDDDADMLVDFGQDPGCTSAADNDEFNTVIGECGPSLEIVDITLTGEATGTLDGPSPNELTSAQCNGFGGEHVFTFQVMNPDSALYVVTDYPETTLDTVVYVRSVCQNPATELECNDDSSVDGPSPAGSELIIEEIETGIYYIIVDAFGPGSLGTFKLTVEERAGLGAPCDDTDPAACVPGLICQPRLPGDPDTCEYARCEDDLDNDGDAVIDFPFEPGCENAADNDETNPIPVPACGNGTDDDGDGLVDYPADPGCEFAGDTIEIDECYPGKPVSPLNPVTGVSGSTVGDTGLAGGSCGGADSPEDIFVIQTDLDLISITATTDSPTATMDTILYVRANDCDAGTEVACNDDIATSDTQSTVTWSPITGTDYFLFLDSKWGTTGSYAISVSGVIAGGSECDPTIPTFICQSGYACREITAGAGDWTCLTSFCNDDVDNDADGFIDYPADPGCANLSDDAEDFPNPITACSNGIDDDGDTFIDWSGGDPGCLSASDNGELDECVPGAPVIDHPGGTVTGTLAGGSSVLNASCDPSGGSTDLERVYVFNNSRTDATLLHFDTHGSSVETVLDIRLDDCSIAGPASWCNDNGSSGVWTSEVEIATPAAGNYFAIVNGQWSGSGPITMTIWGELPPLAPCTPGAVDYICATGATCSAATNTCVPSACNDALDNDGDGDVDFGDPGCADITDNDETDPATLPQCADGIDNDADTFVDYPADPGCDLASDNVEQDCAHDICVSGGALVATCDPCVASVCAVDSYCCTFGWDSICVGEVTSICGEPCP